MTPRVKCAIRLREAGILDVPVLSALHEGCFEDFWTPHSMREVLTSPGVDAWIAIVQDGRGATGREELPVGFAITRVAADEAELLSIGVNASFRRRGVAAELLARVIRHAGSRGAQRLFLEVAEDNTVAQRLYTAYGFAMVGRRPDYYRTRHGPPIAALTLRRYLAPSRWRWSGF